MKLPYENRKAVFDAVHERVKTALAIAPIPFDLHDFCEAAIGSSRLEAARRLDGFGGFSKGKNVIGFSVPRGGYTIPKSEPYQTTLDVIVKGGFRHAWLPATFYSGRLPIGSLEGLPPVMAEFLETRLQVTHRLASMHYELKYALQACENVAHLCALLGEENLILIPEGHAITKASDFGPRQRGHHFHTRMERGGADLTKVLALLRVAFNTVMIEGRRNPAFFVADNRFVYSE